MVGRGDPGHRACYVLTHSGAREQEMFGTQCALSMHNQVEGTLDAAAFLQAARREE
jgi:hypothetical protein